MYALTFLLAPFASIPLVHVWDELVWHHLHVFIPELPVLRLAPILVAPLAVDQMAQEEGEVEEGDEGVKAAGAAP